MQAHDWDFTMITDIYKNDLSINTVLKVKQEWPIVILGVTTFKCPLQPVNKAQSHYIMHQIKSQKLKFMMNYAVLLKIWTSVLVINTNP